MKIQGCKLSCAILQPHYLPWIGYFDMIDRVDVFVLFDDVQFIKREWKNRNRIRKTATSNETKWMTVPINKDSQRKLIKDALISNERDWVAEHGHSMIAVYRYAPYFDEYFPQLQEITKKHAERTLADLNIALLEYFCKIFGIQTRLVRSSELDTYGRREEKLLSLCKILNADFYLANNATAEYVEADFFRKEGIDFGMQDYRHPRYEQKYKTERLPFISYLSVVDLLFNCGTSSVEIIRQGDPRRRGTLS